MTTPDRPATSAITVLIADDQPLQRMGMTMFLRGQVDVEILGEAIDGADAVDKAAMLRPNVVLMDVRMPGMDGIAATRKIVENKTTASAPWVLLLTTFDLDEYVISGLEAGASGFLTKDAEPAELLSAIRAVAAGDAVIAPTATRRLLDRLASGGTRRPMRELRAEIAAVARLTAREAELLTAIGSGMNNTEIAERFFLAESTVKNYISRIFIKIGARDRVQAVIIAYRSGLIDTA